jgi:hypothetical protein
MAALGGGYNEMHVLKVRKQSLNVVNGQAKIRTPSQYGFQSLFVFSFFFPRHGV